MRSTNIVVFLVCLNAAAAVMVAAASSVSIIFEVALAGPTLFLNLGVPAPLVAFVAAPLYVIVGLDVLQVLSGRDLS